MNTANALLNFSQKIGDIAESNGHFFKGLVRRIQKTGKNFDEITVSELLDLIDTHRKIFNSSLDLSESHQPGIESSRPETIQVGNTTIELYPIRTQFENILKLGEALALAQFKEEEFGCVVPTDELGLGKLQNIHNEIVMQIASSIEAVGSVMAFANNEELGERTISDLGLLSACLASMQFSMLDAGTTLNTTAIFLATQKTKA